jgi:hypothetical protein
MKIRFAILAAALTALAPTFVVGCGADSSETKKTGAIDIVGQVSSALDLSLIDHITVSVVADTTSFSTTLNLTKDGGGNWSGQIDGLPAPNTFHMDATAYDLGNVALATAGAINISVTEGNTSLVALNFHPNVLPPSYNNNAPHVSSITAAKHNVNEEESIAIDAVASDPDGDVMLYTWSASAGTVTSGAGTANITWKAPAASGPVTLTLTVDDQRGAVSLASIVVQVGDTPVGSISASAVFHDAPEITAMTVENGQAPMGTTGVMFTATATGGMLSCDAATDSHCTYGIAQYYLTNTCGLTPTVSGNYAPGTVNYPVDMTYGGGPCVISYSVYDASGASNNGNLWVNPTGSTSIYTIP